MIQLVREPCYTLAAERRLDLLRQIDPEERRQLIEGDQIGAVPRRSRERVRLLSEKIANCGRPLRSFDETLRTSLAFLASPCNLWASERLEDKKKVLKLAFADRLAYVRNEGFRTPDLALPLKVLADMERSKSELARPEGKSSNSLVDTLVHWTEFLEAA